MNRSALRSPEAWRSMDRWAIAVAIALALLLLLLSRAGYGPGAGRAGCCGPATVASTAVAPAATTPAAAPAAPVAPAAPAVAALTPPKLDFEVTDGKVTLRGQVADEATREALLVSARARFGADRVIDRLTVGAGIAALGWLPQAGALLGELKKAGPNVLMSLNGSAMTLSGEVGSQAAKDAVGQQASALLGPGVTLDNQLALRIADSGAAPAPAVAASTTPAAIPATATGAAALCEVRIAQTRVYFATGSAVLNAASRRALDAVAGCLGTGRATVSGHTDNTGGKALNQRLSEQRAKAVVRYLSSKGVPAEQLVAQGHSFDQPAADNGSRSGRALNRRVELQTT